MRARVEVRKSASLTVNGRVFIKGQPVIITNEAEINALKSNGRLTVTMLKEETPGKAKVVAKVADSDDEQTPTPPAKHKSTVKTP